MTLAEQPPSPTPTVTRTTPPGNVNASSHPQHQDHITQQDLLEMHGCDELPPHCLDQLVPTFGIERKEYRWGIHCSTEQLNAAVLSAGLAKEGYSAYEVLQAHLIGRFDSPFVRVAVAHRRASQVSAALVSIYPNHYRTAVRRVMKKRGVGEEEMVGYIRELLGVEDKARWYAPLVPDY